MKTLILIIVWIGILCPFFSYAQDFKFTIDGKIDTDSTLHGMIYLISKDVEEIDSVPLVNNRYHFEATLKHPGGHAYITWRDRPLAQQLKESHTMVETGSSLVFIEPGAIQVTHSLPFKKIEVKGSQMHADYEEIMHKVQANRDQLDSIVIAYIRDNPNSWLAYLNLEQFAKKYEPAVSNELFQGFDPELKQYPEVAALGERIASMQKVSVGRIAPEFTLKTVDGKDVSLSDYRGKYVLVDFWASWCAPCRAENPTVSGLYDKFKDKGFDVLGVSLDLASSKEQWIKAMKDDHLPWQQVSDLMGFDGEVAKLYGVHAIPSNFLLDPTGKIIATNLRGYDLEKQVESLFP